MSSQTGYIPNDEDLISKKQLARENALRLARMRIEKELNRPPNAPLLPEEVSDVEMSLLDHRNNLDECLLFFIKYYMEKRERANITQIRDEFNRMGQAWPKCNLRQVKDMFKQLLLNQAIRRLGWVQPWAYVINGDIGKTRWRDHIVFRFVKHKRGLS